jgi:type II secretory pathway pseudopilin PulG
MKRSAVSLVELLIVIGIILVLVGILLPILGNAKLRSNETVCASNLKQQSTAMILYSEDHQSQLPPLLPANILALSPYLRSKEIWVCPQDRYDRGSNIDATQRLMKRVSTFPVPTVLEEFFNALVETTPNHGLVTCYLHGHQRSPVLNPNYAINDFSGRVLTVRKDGSLWTRDVKHRCYTDSKGGSYGGRSFWDAYSDQPMPKGALDEINAGLTEIECGPSTR